MPFPYAVDNHQYHNAKHLQALQAAFIVDESELTAEKIQALVAPLINDRSRVRQMARAAAALAKPNATKDCVDVLSYYLSGFDHAACKN